MRVLAISHEAAEVIKVIVTSSQVSEQGGIRVWVDSVDDTTAQLELGLADRPEPGDALIQEEGAKVFVDENAARFLDDKLLDARVEGEGVAFAILDQKPDPSSNGRPGDIDPGNLA